MPTGGYIIFYRAGHSSGMQDIQSLICTLSHSHKYRKSKSEKWFPFFWLAPL